MGGLNKIQPGRRIHGERHCLHTAQPRHWKTAAALAQHQDWPGAGGRPASRPRTGQRPCRSEPSGAEHLPPGLPAAAEDSRGRRRAGSGPPRRAPGAGARTGGGGPLPDPSPHEGIMPLYPCCTPDPELNPSTRLRRGAPTGVGSRSLWAHGCQGLKEWVGSDGGCGDLPCQG